MAGDAVTWTDEMRAEMSRKMRAIRRSESASKKTARLQKRAKTMKENPEIEEARRSAISRTLKKNQKKLSELAKKRSSTKEARERLSRNSLSGWVRRSKEERSELGRKIAASRASNQKETNKKISSSVKKDWDRSSPEKKCSRIKSAMTSCANEYTLVDGRTEFFHSSWEAACADVLIGLGCEYETQVSFDLGGITYVADFVVDDKVIEVKGFVKAKERWESKVLPAIKKGMEKSWSVYVVDWKPENRYQTLSKFLSDARKVF